MIPKTLTGAEPSSAQSEAAPAPKRQSILEYVFSPNDKGQIALYDIDFNALERLQDAFVGAAEEAGFETEEQLDEYVGVRRERRSKAA